MDQNRRINAGIELIAGLDADYLTALELRDILHSLVTKNFDIIDMILEEAIRQDIVHRSENVYNFNHAAGLEFEKPVKRVVDERGKCIICGKNLTKCCYIEFPSKIYGPFGTGCVQKVHL